MPLRIRAATEANLAAIAGLTAASRARLVDLSPLWWRPAAAADEIHPLWLGHLLGPGTATIRVADDPTQEGALADEGFARTVEVQAWPS